MGRFPIQIEFSKPGPSPADVLPNALAFVRFLNAINLALVLVGAIWWIVSPNDSTGEVLVFLGIGLMAASAWTLAIAVKAHNARVRNAEDREAAVEASRQPDDLDAN
jgi:hypothetical protein